MNDSGSNPQPTLPRRVAFAVMAALLVLLAVEIGAFLMLWWSNGVPPTAARMEAARLAVGPAPGQEAAEQRVREAADEKDESNAFRSHIRVEQVIHPFLGFVNDPVHGRVAKVERFHPEGKAWGFPRNFHPLFWEPSPERVVIGVFGGSVAEIFVAAGSKVLAAELSKSGVFGDKEIVVVSFGLGGFKQPQQLMALNYFQALGAHLDMVINIDGFNEVALPVTENLKKGVFPFYPRSWELRVEGLDPEQRRIFGELTYLRGRRAEDATAQARGALRWSRARALLWTVRDRNLSERISELEHALLGLGDSEGEKAVEEGVRAVGGSESATYQARGPERAYDSWDEVYIDLTRMWSRSSLQMHRLCEASGILYFHFLQPNQYVLGSKPMGELEVKRAFQARNPYRKSVTIGYPRLLRRGERLRAQGVRFHDLTEVFSSVEEPLYFDTCCHFNGKGNHIMAREISRRIVSDLGG